MVASLQGTIRFPTDASHARPRARAFEWSTQPPREFDRGFQHPSPAPSPSFLGKTITPARKLTSTDHRTQQFSVVAISNASGSVVERLAYTAFGQPTFTNASGSALSSSAKATRYTYTGREWDPALELHHFRARWMSGVSGGFMGRDPIGALTADTNLFGYLDGKPFRNVDPLGLSGDDLIWPTYVGPTMGPVHPIRPVKPPSSGPSKPNSKHPWGFNYCFCDPKTKKDRQQSSPEIDSLPPGIVPMGPLGGRNTTYPFPSTPPGPVGGGGAGPCIIVVIKCEETVTVYHFQAGDDPEISMLGKEWSNCQAMVCGGSDERGSNCLADEAMRGLHRIGVEIVGVSNSDACGVLPDGNWYER